MRKRESAFKHPKKQIIIVAAAVLVLYAFLVYLLGWPSIEDILVSFIVALFLQFNLIPPVIRGILFDIFLFGIVFFGSLAFFAQFVLPLHNIEERRDVIVRLYLYVIGRHGPAVTIQDGVEIRRKREENRRGPGVILLDTASAAVLRTAVSFSRAVGPGTVFTKRFEQIAGAVDLHKQTQFIGPRGDEDPFFEEVLEEFEDEDDYEERQKRRYETSGLTRDGVEVVPNIIVGFRVSGEAGDGSTRFGYKPAAVWRAVVHEGVGHGDEGRYEFHWRNLPAYLAADLWREHLRKYTFEELFAFPGKATNDGSEETGLEKILKAMNERLKSSRVERMDEHGRSTDRPMSSREFRILRDRGIMVTFATATNLRFPGNIDDELSKQWRASWLERAKEENRNVRSERIDAQQAGQEEALKDFARGTAGLLGREIGDYRESPQHLPKLAPTAEFLVRGALEQCVRDSDLGQQLTSEKSDLADLIEWLRKN